MSDTIHLGLPLVAGGQAQKHVTVNEALVALDVLAQLAVIDRDRTVPPADPEDGDRHIVAEDSGGDWAGHAGEIAARIGGAWRFHAPRRGWLVHVAVEEGFVLWDGAAWADAFPAPQSLQGLALLGVGTNADAANPFSAKLNGALWTALTAGEGGTGDLRYTLNKEGAGDTLSLLLQTGFSGRAELGLVGDDDVTLKVSPDGVGWRDALRVDGATGEVSVGQARSVVSRSPAGASNEWEVIEEEVVLAGASVATSISIPDRAIVFGVSTRTVQAVNGAASYDCGIAGESAKFGGSLSVAAGATNAGVIGPQAFYAATPIVLTSNGGAFSGGRVRVSIHALRCRPALG